MIALRRTISAPQATPPSPQIIPTRSSSTRKAAHATKIAIRKTFKWLQHRIRKPKAAEVEPFPLLQLPQELIDMVLINLIRANQFNVLMASSAIRAQALPLVKLHYVCDITIGKYSTMGSACYINTPKMDAATARQVQNVKVRFNCDSRLLMRPNRVVMALGYGHDYGIKAFDHFVGMGIHRKACHMVIECLWEDLFTCMSGVLPKLQALRGFEHLSIVNNSFTESRTRSSSPAANNLAQLVTMETRRQGYEALQQMLKSSLGPPKPVGRFSEGIEFFPLRYHRDRVE